MGFRPCQTVDKQRANRTQSVPILDRRLLTRRCQTPRSFFLVRRADAPSGVRTCALGVRNGLATKTSDLSAGEGLLLCLTAAGGPTGSLSGVFGGEVGGVSCAAQRRWYGTARSADGDCQASGRTHSRRERRDERRQVALSLFRASGSLCHLLQTFLLELMLRFTGFQLCLPVDDSVHARQRASGLLIRPDTHLK